MSEVSQDDVSGWLPPDRLEWVRRKLPMVYVDVVPVRMDARGAVRTVGLLLRPNRDGGLSRSLVSGRVLYHEQIRDALLRHIEKDLGPVSLPRLPVTLAPFTVAEYFPTPGLTPFHDPRQHAVALAYVIPVDGDCQPQQDALDLAWLTPEEVLDPRVQSEMVPGHDTLVRAALSYTGRVI